MNLSVSEITTYFFDENPTPMLVFDRKTLQILKVNDAAIQKYGYSVEEFERMNIKDLHSKEEVPVLLRHLEGIDKELQKPHHQHQKKCGDVFYAQVDSRNFAWGDKNVQLAVIHDVSKQVEAQQQLSRAQRIANVGNWEMAFDDMQLYWSDQMYALFGLSKEDFTVTFENFLEYVPKGERDKLQQDLNDAMAGALDKEIQHRIITAGGEIRSVVQRGEVEKDAAGNPVRVSGTMQDITERKKAEEAAKEERKFSRNLIKNLPDAFWLMDNEGNVVHWNDEIEQVSGFSKKEIRQGDVFNFFAEEERAGLQEKLGQAFTEGKATAEATLITKKEEKIPYALTGIKFKYQDKTYITGVGVNIQAQKERQKKLEETENELIRAQQIAGLGSWELDMKDMKLHWSDEVYRIFGLSKEQFTPDWEGFLNCLPAEDQQELQQGLEEMINGAGDDQIEHRILTSQGNIRHVVERGEVDRDGDGNPLKVSGTIQDITERKKIEIDLSKRSKAIESSMDGVAILDDNGQYIFMNEAHASIYGYDSPAELIGESWKTLFEKEELEKVEKEIFTFLEKDGVWKGETLATCKDGSAITTDVTLSKVEGGGITCIVRDISERKKTESELKKNRTNLKRAQEIASLGSFEWDVENDELTYSDEALRIYEIEREDKKPGIDQFVAVIHPKDREFVHEKMEHILNGKGFVEFEHRLLTPSGREKHVVQRGDVEYADDGSAITVFGTVQDITHQKEVESELLRRSKAIDASMDGISIFDADNRIIYVNQAFANMYGYDYATVLEGESWEKLYSKEKIRYFDNEVLPKVEKYGEWRDEDTARRKDGSIFPKEFTFSRVEDGGLICICRDITERRKAEKDIADSLKEKEVLLAEIHHRVKNNLAIISGLLKLEAMNHERDTTIKKVMNESQLRIQSMAMIHEKLYQTTNFTDLRLENYIAELVEIISDTMKVGEKNISINIDSDDIQLNINYAIPCALIINELVTNAFKHAFNEVDEGRLDIKLKSKNGKISLIVQDNGPGMPEDFDKKSKKSLGYVLIGQLVKQLQGKLTMRNDVGSYFEITFRKGEKSGPSSNVRFATPHQI